MEGDGIASPLPVDRYDLGWRARAGVLHVNGKVGAEQGAQSTVDAVGVVDDLGWMIALAVGLLRHDQHVLRAELNAETTPLAPFLDDVDNTKRYLDPIPIQRLSPIGHRSSYLAR
jgi:hypothetical protein